MTLSFSLFFTLWLKIKSFPSPHVLPRNFFLHLLWHCFLPSFSNILDLNVPGGRGRETLQWKLIQYIILSTPPPFIMLHKMKAFFLIQSIH